MAAFLTGTVKADIRDDWVVLKATGLAGGVAATAFGLAFAGGGVGFAAAGETLAWVFVGIGGLFVLLGIVAIAQPRRTVIVDPVARQVSLYKGRALARTVEFEEVSEVRCTWRRRRMGDAERPSYMDTHSVRLLLRGEDLELLASYSDQKLARGVAEAMARTMGKPFRDTGRPQIVEPRARPAVAAEQVDYVEQPSYTGERGRSVIAKFEDGYCLHVQDSMMGWREEGEWQGQRVQVAEGLKADYYHILDTDLVKTVPLEGASDAVRQPAEPVEPAIEPDREREAPEPPPGVQVTAEGSRTILRPRERWWGGQVRCLGAILLPFALFWNGILAAMIALWLASPEALDVSPAGIRPYFPLFLLPFVAVGVGLIVLLLALFYAEDRVVIDRDGYVRETRLFGCRLRTRRMRLDEVKEICVLGEPYTGGVEVAGQVRSDRAQRLAPSEQDEQLRDYLTWLLQQAGGE